MISDEKKKRIESLSTEEMLYEINLGRKSRFQRESFAYLKTYYDNLMSNNVSDKRNDNNYSNPNESYTTISQETKSNPASQITQPIQNPPFKISPLRILEGVIIGVLVVCVLYLIYVHFGLDLRKP